jgi:hypothetical protein
MFVVESTSSARHALIIEHAEKPKAETPSIWYAVHPEIQLTKLNPAPVVVDEAISYA